MKKKQLCIVKGCMLKADFVMCMYHLQNPLIDGFRILDDVEVKPIILAGGGNQMLLAKGLMSIAPTKLRCSRAKSRSIKSQIEKSVQFNSDNLIVKELTRSETESPGNFYSNDESESDCSLSSEFEKFTPLPNKNQLFICAKSKQLLFFIPSQESFDAKSQSKLKRRLVDCLRYREDNVNKNAKVGLSLIKLS